MIIQLPTAKQKYSNNFHKTVFALTSLNFEPKMNSLNSLILPLLPCNLISSIFDLKRPDTRNNLKDCSNIQNIHILHFRFGVLQKYTTQRIRIYQGGCWQKQPTISLTCTLKHAYLYTHTYQQANYVHLYIIFKFYFLKSQR